MADIREIYKALSPEDRLMYSQFRTEMRRTYLNAHNSTMGIDRWEDTDDQFVDLIDIKLAVLFDRAGMMNAERDIIGAEDAIETEQKIHAADDAMKNAETSPSLNEINKRSNVKSDATKLLTNNGAWPK